MNALFTIVCYTGGLHLLVGLYGMQDILNNNHTQTPLLCGADMVTVFNINRMD